MKCLIPGRFIKLFGRAIHCLSKIGDELYLESTEDGLALRTVNSSRSAFGCFLFNESFFHEYLGNSSHNESEKFKLSMKSCLGVFKSLTTLEKSVDTCKLEYDDKETRIVFKFFCKHGIIKTHNLTFQESESLQAVYSKDSCPNLMTTQGKVLIDTAANFPTSCEEVTLSCTPDAIIFRNYLEDEPDPSTVVHTKMKLHPEEFDDYRIGVDTDITFCLKESRAVLGFADFASQPVSIHFSTSGKPVVFSLDGDSLYEADFVLATLMDQPLSSQGDHQMRTPARDENSSCAVRISNTNRQAHRKKKKDKLAPGYTLSAANDPKNPNETGMSNVSNDVTIQDDIPCPAIVRTPACVSTGVNIGQEKDNISKSYPAENDDDFFSESFPYKEMLANSASAKGTAGNRTRNIDSALPVNSPNASQLNEEASASIAFPCVGNSAPKYSEQDVITEDMLLSTPPSKKFKSVFFGTVTDPQEIRKRRKLHETVLAADTDDDDDYMDNES